MARGAAAVPARDALLGLPLLVWLMAVTAMAMLLPALYGFLSAEHDAARPFIYGAMLLAVLTGMIGLASWGRLVQSEARRSHLRALVAAYVVLPPLMAWPFAEALPDTHFVNAWFEMLSSFTTTGATVYDVPGRLPDTLHLWRGLVAWLGGFFILVMAVSVLMPLNLGGMEVLNGRTGTARARQIDRVADPSERMVRFASALAAPYAGFTAVLWFALVLAGETGFHGLCLAMATISTSGILPDGMAGPVASGLVGEALVAVLLCLGLTRRAYPGALFDDRDLALTRDPEIQMAAAIILAVTVILLFRHWGGAANFADAGNLEAMLAAGWGAAFTALSFLSTTGFASAEWETARLWSGMETHGLILLGLTIMGGGVATTAGGVKLLRVYALVLQGQGELQRLVHPRVVTGGGSLARHLRGEGARMAWVFFMLFAISIAVVTSGLTLAGLDFDTALIAGLAGLTTTGPLIALADEAPIRLMDMSLAAKAILGGAMVLGRIEALALLAVLAPHSWRR